MFLWYFGVDVFNILQLQYLRRGSKLHISYCYLNREFKFVELVPLTILSFF
jgi:hypothetical protein